MNLAKSLSVYTSANVLAQSVPLLLLPVLTKYLSQEEYGFIAVLVSVTSFVTPIVFWGAAAAISVEYFKSDENEFKRYLASALVVPIISSLLLTILFFFLSDEVGSLLAVPAFWLVITPFFCFLVFVKHVVGTLFRITNKIRLFAIYEIFYAILGVIFVLVFVVHLQGGWEGRMWAMLIAAMVMAVASVLWLYLNGYKISTYKIAHIKDILRFGAGLIPHDFGNQIIRMSDRLFLVAIVGHAGAGQYAVAAQVAGIMLVLLSAFNQAWTPYLFSQLKENSESAKNNIVNKSYKIIGLFFVFFVVFNISMPVFYFIFVDDKFSSSRDYVIWLTLGYFFMSVYLTYIDYIFYLKKTHILSLITLINMTVNLALNFIFIKQYGAIGSAYAFSVTMFVVMIFSFFISNHLYPMPWLIWRER